MNSGISTPHAPWCAPTYILHNPSLPLAVTELNNSSCQIDSSIGGWCTAQQRPIAQGHCNPRGRFLEKLHQAVRVQEDGHSIWALGHISEVTHL